MMKRFFKKISIYTMTAMLAFSTVPGTVQAHSGRTDSSGGHHDNKNVSGLGSYHYHCGGNPAHLHNGGVCPYSSSAATADTSSTSAVSTTTSEGIGTFKFSGGAAEYPFISRNGYELSWDKDFSKITADTTVNAVWTVIKPEKVTSLTAEIQKNSIDLSWDKGENTDYYLVYRRSESDTDYKQIKKTTQILWTDTDVETGVEYSYKVVGICSLDGKKYQGTDSDIVTAKIDTPQTGDIYSVGDLTFKITSDKEVSVIGLAKEEVNITIPSAVSISGKAYKVTSIQEKAFYKNEDIVSVAIGNNVTYVGRYAFYQCPNLENVKFGKRVSIISTCAFTQCPNLENVTLPSSIKRLGAKDFYQCTSIETLKINSGNLEYVGKKGLAVNKAVTLKLSKKVFTKYQKIIKESSIYSKTKFVKF